MEELRLENEKLKEENDELLQVIAQMRVTLNRLISRYISEDANV